MQKVKVYWNLHKNCWSILDAKTERVIGYANTIELKNVELRVRHGGFERVQREGKKNVHAFAIGELVRIDGDMPEGLNRVITYRPKGENAKPYFFDIETGERVDRLDHAFGIDKAIRG